MKRTVALLALALIAALAWTLRPTSEVEVRPDSPEREVLGRAGETPEDAAPTEASRERPAEVRGRFLLPDGAPAVGVELELHGWRSEPRWAKRFGASETWRWLEPAFSDDEGRVRIEFTPPPESPVVLRASLAGYANENWRWFDVEAGRALVLGEVTLKAAGEVLVRLVDGAGEPISGEGWTVRGMAGAREGSRQHTDREVLAEGPGADGLFRLVGLPAGPVQVGARSQLLGSIEGPDVEVLAGETVEAELRYAGPDGSRRIVVKTGTQPFGVVNHSFESFWLEQHDEFVAEVSRSEGPFPTYSFDDLEPGSYSVHIEDRRFLPWARAGVEPGSIITARLVGNAALALEVVDDASGEPIDAYALVTNFNERRRIPNQVTLHELDEPPPEGGLYVGLIPVPQVLVIGAPGYTDLELRLDLEPDETRTLRARLSRGVPIRGVFSDALGDAAIAGARILLLPTGSDTRELPPEASTPAEGEASTRATHLETRSRASGEFRFASVLPGDYALVGVVNAWQTVVRDPISVRPPPADGPPPRQRFELVSRNGAGLRGRVQAPEGTSCEGLILRVHPEAVVRPGAAPPWGGIELALAADGSFYGYGLPPGPARVDLSQVEVRVPPHADDEEHSSTSFVGLNQTLAHVVLTAGEFLERDFEAARSWPGSLEVEVREGASPAAVDVELYRPGASSPLAVGRTDPTGLARIAPLAPGSYVVHLRSGLDRWSWNSEQLVLVQANSGARLALDYTLASGTLTMLDAESGAPLAQAQLLLAARDNPRDVSYRTDAEGRVQLTLPVGHYRVSLAGSPAERQPLEFEWTASGPALAELRLERP